MEVVILGISVATLAVVILTLVAPPTERRRPARNTRTSGCHDDSWSPAFFSSDGGSSDCSGADAGCGGDGGGGGGGD